MSKYSVKSPAKINIGLRVLSKRKDGYHNIETIFYPLKIYDDVTLQIAEIPGSKNRLTVKSNLKIAEKDNICYKAAELFLKKFKAGSAYRVEIHVKKNIPIGAGLGGGSANAASVLKILAKHFKKRFDEILRTAAEIGSDVPFFISGKPAYAAGKGEKLTPLPEFRIRRKIFVVNPGIHVSTPWAYNELKIKNYKLKTLSRVTHYSPEDKRLMINDFERVVFKKYPVIEKIKYDMFMLGAEFALMSGSGSTVYGIFEPKKIKAAEKYFRGFEYKVFTG